MELRTAASPRDVKNYTTQRLREEFLIPQLFFVDDIKLVYSHIDRIIDVYKRQENIHTTAWAWIKDI